MKILKQFFSVLFVLLCVVGTGYAATFDGVRELVSRRAHGWENIFNSRK